VIRKDGVPTQGLPGEHLLSNTRQRDGTDHTLKFLVSVFASVGSILYGYDLGVIAGVVASPDFKARFEASGAEEGAVVSVFTGGAFFGAMFAGPAGDLFGRRLTILIGSIIFILGGGLQTGAQSLEYLYAGRVIAGIGVGFLVMIIPLYQAEIAHPSIRGSVTALQQFMLGIGALVASWTTFGTNQNFADNDSMQWRLSLGIQIIPAVVLGLLIMFFPESPRYARVPVQTIPESGPSLTSIQMAHRPVGPRRIPPNPRLDRLRTRKRRQILHGAVHQQIILPPSATSRSDPSQRSDDGCVCDSVLFTNYLRDHGY
jgi:MFS family permease